MEAASCKLLIYLWEAREKYGQMGPDDKRTSIGQETDWSKMRSL